MGEKWKDLYGDGKEHFNKTFGEDEPKNEASHGPPVLGFVEKERAKKIHVPPMTPFTFGQNVKRFLFAAGVMIGNFLGIEPVFPIGENQFLYQVALIGPVFDERWAADWTVASVLALVFAFLVTYFCHTWWHYFCKHDLSQNLQWVLDTPRERAHFFVISTLFGLSILGEIVGFIGRMNADKVAESSELLEPGIGFFATLAISLLIILLNSGIAYLNSQNSDDQNTKGVPHE